MTGKLKPGPRYRDPIPNSSSCVLDLTLIGRCRPVLPILPSYFPCYEQKEADPCKHLRVQAGSSLQYDALAYERSTAERHNLFWRQIGSGRRCRRFGVGGSGESYYVTRGKWLNDLFVPDILHDDFYLCMIMIFRLIDWLFLFSRFWQIDDLIDTGSSIATTMKMNKQTLKRAFTFEARNKIPSFRNILPPTSIGLARPFLGRSRELGFGGLGRLSQLMRWLWQQSNTPVPADG